MNNTTIYETSNYSVGWIIFGTICSVVFIGLFLYVCLILWVHRQARRLNEPLKKLIADIELHRIR